MKKALYIGSVVGVVIIFWLIIGCVLALFSTSTNFWYAVGFWCGQPYVFLLAVGMALLFRRQLYSLTHKTTKSFKPNIAYWLIGIGILWGAWMIGVRALSNYAHEKAI